MQPVEGTIVLIDLDNFSSTIKEKGWSEWKPNDATALLTSWVYDFISRHQGVVVWGLDDERGTEEVVIEIPFKDPNDVKDELQKLKMELNSLGVNVSIVALKDVVTLHKARRRREAFHNTPGRRRAHKLLNKLKRRGGNFILVI
jgi:hypothetical protein